MTVDADHARRPTASGLPIRNPLPASARGLLAQVRSLVRSSEILLVLFSGLVGSMAGVFVTLMSDMSQAAHVLLFHIALDERLSATARVHLPTALLAPVGGG